MYWVIIKTVLRAGRFFIIINLLHNRRSIMFKNIVRLLQTSLSTENEKQLHLLRRTSGVLVAAMTRLN